MTEWITVEHFITVLQGNGFTVKEEDGWLIVSRESEVYPYRLRDDRKIPPKTFARFVYKYGIPIEEFVSPPFVR